MRAALILLALSLLAAPSVSAGVGGSFDVLPEGTSSCWDYENETQNHTVEQGPWGYYAYGYYDSHMGEGCTWRTDAASANVTANGHDVAGVLVSEGGHDGWSSSSWGEYAYGNSWYNDSSYGYHWSTDHDRWSYDSAQGRTVDATTGVAAAGLKDGCDSSGSHDGTSQYSGSSSSTGNSSSGSWGMTRYAEGRSTAGCRTMATVGSGITTASGGYASRCDREESGWYSYDSSYRDGESYAWNSSSSVAEERCRDGLFASAGSEDVQVGSRSRCESYSWTGGSYSYSQGGNTSNETYYGTGSSSCDSREGVFGPQGLAVYLGYRQDSWYDSYQGNETSGSSEWRSVGVSHDYVGTRELFVPVLVLPLP